MSWFKREVVLSQEDKACVTTQVYNQVSQFLRLYRPGLSARKKIEMKEYVREALISILKEGE